jgi:periplasmic glucans biosynthesis protein
VVRSYALPVVGTENQWRLTFDVKATPETETVDLRAYLRKDGEPLTETWLAQIHPQQIARMRPARKQEM